jgi:transcription initiation factor IIE alpha subunit
MNQKIICPNCQTEIVFNVYSLLQGAQFMCPNPECNAKISLTAESKEQVKEAMTKLDELKKKIFTKKK